MAAERNLLFGLLALQNGLVDQATLVAAFQAWIRDKSKSLADHMSSRGDLDVDQRAAVDAMVTLHLRRHSGDTQKSLASLPLGRSTRDQIATLGDAECQATLKHLSAAPTEPGDRDQTLSYAIGSATSEGQRFRVLRPHARGGLGAVFVALDSELHREVALKQILDSHADDPTSRQRFLLEAEITGGLEHPGIVPVYGLGTYADGKPYYAMRFIRGDSLKEAIERYHDRGPGHAVDSTAGDHGAAAGASPGTTKSPRALELRRLLRRFLDVCNAIDYAHSRGVLHRDIKPGNIIIGKYGETLVVDWGLAKAATEKHGERSPGLGIDEKTLVPSSTSGSTDTLPGSAIGTPGYMSPEQAAGALDQLGPQSDVYSLGATLYCILTGTPPFEGADVGTLLRRVQRGEFVPPRQKNPDIDKALEAVCLKALALRPQDRYESPKMLADDLEHWLADEPVTAWPEPFTRRARRWMQRHKPLVASVAGVMISAVAALSVAAVLINNERAKAEENFRQARAAVDEYFTKVSESRLLNVPGLQPLRKELLDSARAYYKDFLKERSDDPAVKADAAKASFRVGWVGQALGETEAALQSFRLSTALYDDLVKENPGREDYARTLAICHGAQGLSLAGLDRRDEAIAEHRIALKIRESIVERRPDDIIARIDVARTHRNIGDLLRAEGKPEGALAEWGQAFEIAQPLLSRELPREKMRVDLTGRDNVSAIVREDLGSLLLDRAEVLREGGRHTEAKASWDEGRSLFEDLVRENPSDLSLRSRLADCFSNGHSLEYDQGRFEEALELLTRALALREEMADANPDVLLYRRALAEALLNQAYLHRLLNRDARALESYDRAGTLAEAILRDDRDSTYTKNLLAQSLSGRAIIHAAQGNPAEAVSLARRAAEILEPVVRSMPTAIFHVSALTNVYRSLGRAEASVDHQREALKAFESAIALESQLASRYPGCRYNLACTYALMSEIASPDERERNAANALATLRQAFAQGYSNVRNMRLDPDLNALRGRDDYQRLERELAFPHQVFAEP